MNKLLLTCFLALLCLVGRYLAASSKVADLPPEKSLHRSTLQPVSLHSGDIHRGGAILPDTYSRIDFGLVDSDQDMGAGEEGVILQPAPVTVFASSFSQISNQPIRLSLELSGDEGPKLAVPSRGPRSVSKLALSPVEVSNPWTVDGGPKYETASFCTSAPSTSGSIALIYGEIINPDSLGPLQLVAHPHYIDANSPFNRQNEDLELLKGEFFDGVFNPRTKKFSAKVRLENRPGYFSILLEERPFLEEYLIFPGDSLKISIDLMKMDLLFAGPQKDFYEAQYAIKRERKRRAFESPRQIVTSRSGSLFTSQESLYKMEKYSDHFGSKLLVLEPGKESLDYLIQELEEGEGLIKSQLELLSFYSPKLTSEQIELLKSDIMGSFYGPRLASFRKFHFESLKSITSSDEKENYIKRIQGILTMLDQEPFGEFTQLVSAPYLQLIMERTILMGIWNQRPFLDQVDLDYSGELADRMRAGFLSVYLRTFPDTQKALDQFLAKTGVGPWRNRIESLVKSHVPGEKIQPISLHTLSGNLRGREDLLGQPTLLYFYFSTCTHSADFFQNFLYPLYQDTKNLGYRLIPISVDTDQELWKSRIERYSNSSLENLNLRGESKNHWVDYYEIHAYPKAILLNEEGKILSFNIRNLGKDYPSFKSEFISLFQSAIQSNQSK